MITKLLDQKKKHVLFIVENATIPLDWRVFREAQAVNEWDYKVSIISPKGRNATRSFENINGIDIYRYPTLILFKGRFAFIFEFANAIFWQIFLAIRIFIKKPFHIIHAANPPDNIFIVALFFKLWGVSYIFDHHDLAPELYLIRFAEKKDILYKILLLHEKISCKLADAIISTNESYKRIVASRHSVDPEKIFIVRNDPIFSESLLKNKENDLGEKNKIVILYLGTINPQDGVIILVQVIHYLVNNLNRKNFICSIIGSGDSLQLVKQTVKELKLEHFFNFKGFIYEKEKVKEYLYLSDICIEPAPDNELNKHSTFIKIMEYMAAAKPIVAFDLLETKYSANNSAIFVEPGDIIGFAKAINKLIDDPQLRKRLGNSGQKKIKNELNWDKSMQNLKNIYCAFLKRKWID